MRVLEAVRFDAVMDRFAHEHPFDASDQANSNDEAEGHIRNAELKLRGRWHRVLLEGRRSGTWCCPGTWARTEKWNSSPGPG